MCSLKKAGDSLTNPYTSNLAYLMDALNVSGKELAGAIHMDVSLISKWRNKKRVLNYRSPYFSELVEYFLKVDKVNHYHVLKRLFSSDEEPIVTLPQLKQSVERFLMDDVSNLPSISRETALPEDPSRKVFDYRVRFFKGIEGTQEGVEQILDAVLQAEESTELLFYSQEDLKWIMKDSDFLASWNNKMLSILQQSHKITLINGVDDRIFLEPEAVKHWISYYTHQQIKSYYDHQPTEDNLKVTLMILREKMVLYSINYSQDPKDRYTAIYTDPFSIATYTVIFEDFLKRSKPHFLPFPLAALPGLKERVYPLTREATRYFIYSYMPNLIHFPQDLIRRVLHRHGVPDQTIAGILSFQEDLNNFPRTSLKILYNIDLYRQIGDLEEIRIETLSYLAGRQIFITREELKELLASIKSLMKSDDHFSFAFVQETDQTLLFPVNAIVASRKFIVTYNPVDTKQYFLSTEISTTMAFEYYFEHLWQQVPLVQKNPLYVIDTLDSLIDQL